MNENDLSSEEIALIRKHREDAAKASARLSFKAKAIKTAASFDEWSEETREGLTFSTFVNSFGYQDGDAKLMYEAVSRINNAAFPEENPPESNVSSRAYINAESLINELSGLQTSCELRERDLRNNELDREKARAAASAYGYCILRLRYLS